MQYPWYYVTGDINSNHGYSLFDRQRAQHAVRARIYCTMDICMGHNMMGYSTNFTIMEGPAWALSRKCHLEPHRARVWQRDQESPDMYSNADGGGGRLNSNRDVAS